MERILPSPTLQLFHSSGLSLAAGSSEKFASPVCFETQGFQAALYHEW